MLRDVVCSSPTLVTQIDDAVSTGSLRQLRVLGTGSHASGEYHAKHGLIRLDADLQSDPGLTAFFLGHEVQHATDSKASMRVVDSFHKDVRHTARTTTDYTQAIAA